MTRNDLLSMLSRLAAATGGREPDESNVAMTRGIADALGIDKRDDAYMTLIAFFDHYYGLYDAQYAEAEKLELRTIAKWAACAVLVLLLLCGGAMWGVHHYAYKSGRMEAVPAKYGEFVRSQEFEGAFLLYQNGELLDLVSCTRRGWKKKNGKCYPFDYQDQHGDWRAAPWRIE